MRIIIEIEEGLPAEAAVARIERATAVAEPVSAGPAAALAEEPPSAPAPVITETVEAATGDGEDAGAAPVLDGAQAASTPVVTEAAAAEAAEEGEGEIVDGGGAPAFEDET